MQTKPLTGDALLLLNAHGNLRRATKAGLAGYRGEDGRIKWTAFYEALLAAGCGPAIDWEGWRNIARCARERFRLADGAAAAAAEDCSALAALRISRRLDTPPACISDSLPDTGVYVACLASYNAGRLYGRWLDLDFISDADDIREGIDWVIRHSPARDAEEYAIHDHSGLPAFLTRSEWPDLDKVAEYVTTARELGEDAGAFEAWCENLGAVVGAENFSDAYRGCYDSEVAFCQEYAEEQGIDVSDAAWPLCCIDWDAAWRYLNNGDFCSISAGLGKGVYVFCGG